MSTQQKVFIALLSLYLSVPLFGNSQKIALVDYDEVQRGPILNKGAAWKMWNSIFTACMKSEMLKNPKYLGASNTIGLGSICDKSLKSTKRELRSLNLTEDEQNRVVRLGALSSCEFSQSMEIDFRTFLQSSIAPSGSIEGELNVLLTKQKTMEVSVKAWSKDELVTDELLDILNDEGVAKSKRIINFKKSLLKNGNIILVRVVKVNSFTSLIRFATNLEI